MTRLNDNNSQQNTRRWLLYLIATLFVCLLLPVNGIDAAEQKHTEAITDLRILVDVSGSMKKNDPKNLRRDALRLLIGMLPENSRVGIWSFGQYVNMQVKPGFATKAWKKNARKEANTIRSLGLYTNIEDTLTKSSWDWRRPDPRWDRHMILLTDGMVDISKDPNKNKKSRQNILGRIVSDLKAANVKIHTIALSKHADHELLKTLSSKTDGWYESVDSADKLQRLFLRLFEKTTRMDSLPLEDNLFDVDDSISDMTLLVFRSASGKETKVLAPDHSVIEYAKHNKEVEWYKDKNFDIITIHKPMVGKWKLDADIDKDNRVKIISNLKLRVRPLPIDIIENEAVDLQASIITNEGLLDDKEVLSLIKVTAHNTGYKGNEVVQEIPASKVAGQYEAALEGISEKGMVQVVVKVVSPTFKRESRHEIKVHENPVKLSLKATPKGLVIDVKEDPLLLQVGTLQLALRIEGNKGAYYVTKFGAHHWQATLDNSFSGKAITIDATANRIGNSRFKTTLHGRLPEAIKPLKDPVTVWAEKTDAGVVIKAMLEENILQTGTVQFSYSENENKHDAVTISQQTDKVWQQLLPSEDTGKTLIVLVSGHRLSGESFKKEYQLEVPKAELKEPVVNEHAAVAEEHKDSKEQHAEEKDHASEDVDEAEQAGEEETSTLVIIIALVVSNIIIFAGAFFAYRYWRKKNKPVADDLEESEDNPADTQADESAVINEEKEVPESVIEPDNDPDEDFSAQRKEPTTPDEVDLNVDEMPDLENADASEPSETAETDDMIETALADDLPELDMEMDLEASEDSTKETKDE